MFSLIQLLHPLLRLRQACCHPQAVKGEFLPLHKTYVHTNSTCELGYDGSLYDGFLHMTDDMLCPSPMHIKYASYVYDRFCI